MPPINAPAIRPPARPGPKPPLASAGAGAATAAKPSAVALAKTSAVFLIVKAFPIFPNRQPESGLKVACQAQAHAAESKFNFDERLFTSPRLLALRGYHAPARARAVSVHEGETSPSDCHASLWIAARHAGQREPVS